jgi:hypothetical protein
MKKLWLPAAAMALALVGLDMSAHAGELRAGASRVPITPTADQFPYTVQGERSFVGVHDEVYARALVLDDGTTRAAIVVVDAESVPDATRVVSEVAKAAEVPASNVIVAASHSHSTLVAFYHGGEPNPIQAKELEHIRQGAVQATREAASRLRPARIAFARGEAWVSINNGELAELKARYDPKGPSDHTLDVVRVESDKGEPLALLSSFSTHAETMFRSVTKDGGYEVSGDIPGAVSRMLEANPAGAPVALSLPGAEGDQKPLFQSVQPAVGKMPAQDEGAGGWAVQDAQAQRVTAAVFQAMAAMQPGTSNVTLKVSAGAAVCPAQPHVRTDAQTGKSTSEERPPVSIPLSAIRINDIAIAAVGGDIGSDFGPSIRAASPVPHTLVASMLAGSLGYILPDVYYAHPGHIRETLVKAGCAEHAIPDGIAKLLGTGSK